MESWAKRWSTVSYYWFSHLIYFSDYWNILMYKRLGYRQEKTTNHSQHLVHEVSYICKCMQTRDSNFTGSLCRQSDELCNLQGEIYFISLRYPKGTSASCFPLLWETSSGKSQQCSICEPRQERIAVLHSTDLSTLFCPLSMYGAPHGSKGVFSDHTAEEGCLVTKSHQWGKD